MWRMCSRRSVCEGVFCPRAGPAGPTLGKPTRGVLFQVSGLRPALRSRSRLGGNGRGFSSSTRSNRWTRAIGTHRPLPYKVRADRVSSLWQTHQVINTGLVELSKLDSVNQGKFPFPAFILGIKRLVTDEVICHLPLCQVGVLTQIANAKIHFHHQLNDAAGQNVLLTYWTICPIKGHHKARRHLPPGFASRGTSYFLLNLCLPAVIMKIPFFQRGGPPWTS